MRRRQLKKKRISGADEEKEMGNGEADAKEDDRIQWEGLKKETGEDK
jgi:hypothetical protein